ncbi:metalloregulator ArsR/SmtB family transcription factor [Altererythrobacter luteolus]|uniref:Metalloregulator ArsR/SmtB family transcription factor n=1 Tax=Pontixanthobacter luteolus TaxID=295089 RepID=A0A6I4V048_9SPHN|nr:metalloregulator ArsR/SmtB family transcription factor [Pontixanthobacter luteolus]MXP45794.1 metalloregulator ArsR/SmtB family transcription factor [Pontixanthobacter luteolus]
MQIETTMRALADPTRLRVMRLLSAMELAVGELAQVLGQSQPRVSRHVAILCDAGLAERHREGSWVFLRAAVGNERGNPVGEAVSRLLATAEREDPDFAAVCADDRRQLSSIRGARELNAANYFAKHADDWDELRQLHSPDKLVEDSLVEALGTHSLGQLLDIGTGSGRMAELFAPNADHIVALDKSLDMLRVARAKLQNLPADAVELVQGDFVSLPFAAHRFDTILLHQVLHFAQDPAAALAEAARVTRPAGRIAIVDFAAHDREELRDRHAHARLGFTDKAIRELLKEAGFTPAKPISLDEGELTVKIWLGTRQGGPSSTDLQKVAS